MTRFGVFKKGFEEGRKNFNELPADEKPVAAIVILGGTIVFLAAVLGLLALVFSFIEAFWWVPVCAVALWYFWPQIKDLFKKRG